MPKVEYSGNTKTTPAWAGDFGGREHIMPFPALLDASQFNKTDAVTVTVNDASVAAGDTSITVEALSGPIPAGATLDFSGGTNAQIAKLSAAAAAGATTLTVYPLDGTIADDSVATYEGSASAKKTVYGGTPVGRTYAERDAKDGFGPAASTDDEFFLVYSDVVDVTQNAEVELYRPGSLVKENYLPGWSGFSTAIKNKIRSVYQCITGTD